MSQPGPSKGGVYGAAVPDHRKKWDIAEFEQRAKERLDNEALEQQVKEHLKKKEKIRREELKPRDFKVDLDSRIGKTVLITKTTPSAESGGYYCDVCDCTVKDSINFLDHINGKKHQKNMGMSMRVKKSTVDDVKARFEAKIVEKEMAKKEADYQERLEDLKEEEQRIAEYRKQKKLDLKQRKRKANREEEAEVDPDMAALMGFSGFAAGKS